MARWQAVSDCFPANQADWMAVVFPREFEVDADALMNKPSAQDPLGSTASMYVTWRMKNDVFEVCVQLFGEPSPWLEPAPLRAWLLVQYPDIMRIRR